MYTHIHSLILGVFNSRSVGYDDSGDSNMWHPRVTWLKVVSTFTVNGPVVVAILTSACQASPLAFYSANRLGVEDIKSPSRTLVPTEHLPEGWRGLMEGRVVAVVGVSLDFIALSPHPVYS